MQAEFEAEEAIKNGTTVPAKLPDLFSISKEQFETYRRVWAIWKRTGKRHLLSEIMKEPEEAWTVVLEIDFLYEEIKNGLKEKDEQ